MQPTTTLKKRLLILCGIAGLFAGAYGFRQATMAPNSSTPQSLRGDADGAQAALEVMLRPLSPRESEQLLLKYATDPSPGLRYAVAEELAKYSDEGAASALTTLFSDWSSNVRESALAGLVKVDRERGIRLLAAALSDEDTKIRESAAEELEYFGDKRVVPNLIQALGCDDPTMVRLTIGTLRHITGKRFVAKLGSTSAELAVARGKWQSWWSTAKETWPNDPLITGVATIHPTRIDPAPPFFMLDIDGHPFSLAGQQGRITVLNFWGTWCPPCQSEIPNFVQIDKNYKAVGVDVVGIALHEDSTDSLRKWCQGHGVTYRQVTPTDSFIEAYGQINELPVTLLIDGKGRIRYRWDGPRDYRTIRNAVDRVLREQSR
ncbi:MAG TPA: redoxin domain-containing protein [Capsulimonadaceae bacterium]|jgi:peroxiredoxin